VTGLVALVGAGAWPAMSYAHPIKHRTSANWAGYADTAYAPLSAVSAEWVQPAASCDQPYPTYSAFWVGIGGYKHGSRALEQIGSEADCTAAGRSATYAWYELVPSPSIKLRLAVHPGNLLKARVAVRGELVTVSIQNVSTGRGVTKSIRVASPDESSAEWIAEAPSACASATQCQPLPLSDFGTVSFTQAQASTSRGHTGTITDPSFSTTEITLSPGGPVTGPAFVASASSGEAAPSAVAPNGSAFTVTYEQTSSSLPPLPFASPDRLRHGITAP
jgi:hypothetical protein